MTGLAGGFYYGQRQVLSVMSASSPSQTKTGDAAEASIRLPPLPTLDFENGPQYDSAKYTVVFVLGGPGVGKGTQCAKLVEEYDFEHICAGDLLREERLRPNSPYAQLIDWYIKEGRIVPYEITISLLRDRMAASGKRRFLIDGFPRNVEQGMAFELAVCPSRMVLFFECSEEEMLKRLISRSQSSGRTDDNLESIKKRFRVFEESTIPVREFYNDLNKLRAVNCSGSVDDVYRKTKCSIEELNK